jgi:hypothetical protein
MIILQPQEEVSQQVSKEEQFFLNTLLKVKSEICLYL